ncbi:hypothetical protein Hanom_Chr05g00428241 [Helianthus anomalus]
MSLSTPQTSTPIPPTFLPLLDAIETQTLISPFHSPATPLKFDETLGGNSIEAATTTGEPIDFQLDSGYIYKSSLKATTIDAIIVTYVPIGSPQYQDKGAFGSTNLENSLAKEPNTITSCRDLDDPIKLGYELRYKELTERMNSMESSLAEMKDMMKHSKCQPSIQQIANEL